MLRSLKGLEQYTVSATDGDIGCVVDFLLDDEKWAVRYLIVKTNGLFEKCQALISPISFRSVAWALQRFELVSSKAKVRHSPGVDVDEPVSRQHEWDYYRYYQYPHYWRHSGLWGAGAYPDQLATREWGVASLEHPADVHLHRAQEVCGYLIQGIDADVGRVEDFIVDDDTWEVRYLVIDTSNWWFGKKVLIAPHWASSVSWDKQNVQVDLSRDVIKNGPVWDASAAISREYEVRLYDYYGRPLCWDGGDPLVEATQTHHSVAHPG